MRKRIVKITQKDIDNMQKIQKVVNNVLFNLSIGIKPLTHNQRKRELKLSRIVSL